MEKWEGKTAIVTGASSGIGEAIVRDLVKHGINVVALARRVEKLNSLKEQLKEEKGEVVPVKCDVSDKSSTEAAFEEIEKKVGIVHILINNAGISVHKSILGEEDGIEETITNTVNTNFIGLVRVTRAAYKLMKKSEDYGMIVNIGSIAGHCAFFTPFLMNVYPSTKFAVRAVTEAMRQELIKFNDLKIRVCEISPGAVETEIFEAGGWLPEDQKSMADAFKMPILKSSDVSQTVLFMLMLPYNVNITEMIVKPVGEQF